MQPNRPLFFTTAPGAASGIDLQWLDNSTDETGFEIERRPLGAAPFAPLQTLGPDATAFTDATPLPGIVYEYRVRATETPANSTWSFTATTAAPGMETPYQAWLQSVGLPMDGSGAGAPLAAPAGDNIANLTKYGLGLDPAIGGYEGRFASDVLLDGGLEYFRLTYVRPEPPPSGVAYRVEASPDLIGWTSFGITSISTRLGG